MDKYQMQHMIFGESWPWFTFPKWSLQEHSEKILISWFIQSLVWLLFECVVGPFVWLVWFLVWCLNDGKWSSGKDSWRPDSRRFYWLIDCNSMVSCQEWLHLHSTSLQQNMMGTRWRMMLASDCGQPKGSQKLIFRWSCVLFFEGVGGG